MKPGPNFLDILLNERGAVRLSLFLATSHAIAASGQNDLTQRIEPVWPAQPIRIDLRLARDDIAQLEFSTNNNYICVSLFPQPPIGDLHKIPFRNLVFECSGKSVPQATNTAGDFVEAFRFQFPKISWRSVFSDFCKDLDEAKVAFWGFSPDQSLGVRFLKPRRSHFDRGTVQLWRLSPHRQLMWATPLPEPVMEKGCFGFFTHAASNCVLAASQGETAYILQEADGQIIDKFSYGRGDADAGLHRHEKTSHAAEGLSESSLGFFAGTLAFEPTLGLLACGAEEGLRVRLVAARPPHNPVFQVHSEKHPRKPFGGEWNVARLDFYAGKYLLVAYTFGGRLTSKSFDPVEIYDLSEWKLVWNANAKDIDSGLSPVISPDGKHMALLRAGLLEIGEFNPRAGGITPTH